MEPLFRAGAATNPGLGPSIVCYPQLALGLPRAATEKRSHDTQLFGHPRSYEEQHHCLVALYVSSKVSARPIAGYSNQICNCGGVVINNDANTGLRPMVAPLVAPERSTLKISFGSALVSPLIATAIVCVFWFARKWSVPAVAK